MKIQCDVCGRDEASVFCPADEAALCDGCDRRVHHANKLAGKHTRFSLLHSSFKEAPRCDICQDRRAFLFCQEDRAIICRECDIPIHRANEHTQRHNRFLLTGVKLSASSSSYPASSSSDGCYLAAQSEIKDMVSGQLCNPKQPLPSLSSTASRADDKCTSQEGSISTSSISEYLLETLPGWRFEEFIEPSCHPHGFSKMYDRGLPLLDQDVGGRDIHPSSLGDSTLWVPQAPPQSSNFSLYQSQIGGVMNGFRGSELEESLSVMKHGGSWSTEERVRVPQFSPASA